VQATIDVSTRDDKNSRLSKAALCQNIAYPHANTALSESKVAEFGKLTNSSRCRAHIIIGMATPTQPPA
jgi:hypothetical protein